MEVLKSILCLCILIGIGYGVYSWVGDDLSDEVFSEGKLRDEVCSVDIQGKYWFEHLSVDNLKEKVTSWIAGRTTITYAIVDGKEYDVTSKCAYHLGPQQQKFMREFIEKTRAKIPDNPTSLQVKKTWINASREFCASQDFDAFGSKEDWFGYVDSIYMRDDGSITLDVQIDQTDNEVQDRSLSKYLEDVALQLKKGNIVKFSGNFKKGKLSENECLRGGLDSNPELYNEGYVFQFTKLEKILTKTVEVK